ncbi:MAG: YfcE family phosphodiesterase [Candidatus Magasanikbacteria bacterium]|jgi:hypothetical protein
MKILIISDSHDNVPNLEKVLKWAQTNDIGALIHAGDLSAPSVLIKTLSPRFNKEIYLINGNVTDKELLAKASKDLANVKYLGDEGEVQLGGKKIYVTHFPQRAQVIASAGVYDLVIHGHTHQAGVAPVGDKQILNPGTLGGLYYPPTFSIYDTTTGEVKIGNLSDI